MLCKWLGEGTDVGYLCVTDGSAGSNEVGVQRAELAVVREREQREACAVLGVKDVTFLGIPDGMVEVTLDLRRAITREVRRFRPEVLAITDPSRLRDAESREV